MDLSVSEAELYTRGKEKASGVEIMSQTPRRNGEKVAKMMDEQELLESSSLVHTGASKAEEESNVVDAEGTLDNEVRSPERSDEEEIVDVSPSGSSLSSLGIAKKEQAGKVKNMFVFDNTFTVLPASIRKYKNLRKLKFFSNEVRTLPEELAELTQLEQLYLKVSPAGLGSLPPLEKLRSLKALELHQVPVRPSASSLSREIAQLHSLTRLSICHFSISWVPVELGMLENLEELDLSFNKLKTLPKELGGLVSLKSLRVASNKLADLPPDLTNLPRVTSIDVSHNRLASLSSLRLPSMTSLRVLDAQFNKLQQIGEVPDWIVCKLDGNDKLQLQENNGEDQTGSGMEDYLLDWEPSDDAKIANGIDGNGDHTVSAAAAKGTPGSSKGHVTVRGRRGWKKQDNQQQKARQDRLNSSRKHRSEDNGDAADVSVTGSSSDRGSNFDIGRKDRSPEKISQGKSERKPESLNAANKLMKSFQPHPTVAELNGGENGEQADIVIPSSDLQANDPHQAGNVPDTVKKSLGSHQHDQSSIVEVEEFQIEGSAGSLDEENRCRKAISGDRSKLNVQEASLEDQGEEANEETSESLNSCISVAGTKVPRRQDSDTDRNPKPSKRRRSVQGFSEVSLKYCVESFVGFDDRLHDGFYDAGRDRPFLPLEVLEKEQLCFDSREVILVDREKDEELDVMALSAQQLLARLETSQVGDRTLSVYQRIATLALFVSDCFGGSDKTYSISNMRRSALGGTAGMPFVCSCSSSNNVIHMNKLGDKSTSGAVLPSVDMLCEGAVRFLKAQQGSNILPIGSFPYGVCRHRAILFKYLCDRAEPVIPCELVRGYLDYMPHAWNVVLVKDLNESARMLVDACRPLDIRQEQDPEYFCRYIPFKRIKLPVAANVAQTGFSSETPTPVLHEDIGHGASGATVQRCTFGTFTAAAKVRQLEAIAEGPVGMSKGLENSCLSELRILCSLQHHPCIVGFYGHQLASGVSLAAESAEAAPQPPRLIIFMEYVHGGSLEAFLQGLQKKGQAHMPPKLALHVARNVACALSLLHSKRIIHRDIKSSNVLIDLEAPEEPYSSTPTVKLCDFDSAVPLQSSSAHTCYLAHRGVPSADVCVGTPRWIAPEVLRAMYGRHSYGLEADLWSFGCLLAELLTLKVPYDGLTETEVHSRIQIGQRPQLPAELEKLRSPASRVSDTATYSADEMEMLSTMVRLFYSCTEPSPSKRPSAQEVFSALDSELARRACTTSQHDGHIIEATTALEEVPEVAFGPEVESESLSTSEKKCVLCLRPAKNCTCTSGLDSEENNRSPSDSDSSKDQ
ncbi:unnamed protein product [Calypogeia fissa]